MTENRASEENRGKKKAKAERKYEKKQGRKEALEYSLEEKVYIWLDSFPLEEKSGGYCPRREVLVF